MDIDPQRSHHLGPPNAPIAPPAPVVPAGGQRASGSGSPASNLVLDHSSRPAIEFGLPPKVTTSRVGPSNLQPPSASNALSAAKTLKHAANAIPVVESAAGIESSDEMADILRETWLRLTEEQSMYSLAMLFAKHEILDIQRRLGHKEEDLRRATSVTTALEYAERLTSEVNGLKRKIEEHQKSLETYTQKRRTSSEEMATIIKKVFETVHSKTCTTTPPPTSSNNPVDTAAIKALQTEILSLKTELMSVKKVQEEATRSQNQLALQQVPKIPAGPSQEAFDLLRREFEDFKAAQAQVAQPTPAHDGPDYVAYALLRDEVRDLARKVENLPAPPNTSSTSTTSDEMKAIKKQLKALQESSGKAERKFDRIQGETDEEVKKLTGKQQASLKAIRDVEKETRSANSEAQKAKVKAQTIFKTMTDRLDKLREDIDQISSQHQQADSSNVAAPSIDLTSEVLEKLRSEFAQTTEIQAMQASLESTTQKTSSFDSKIQELTEKLTEIWKSKPSRQELSEQIQKVSTTGDAVQAQLAQCMEQLRVTRQEVGQVQAARQALPVSTDNDTRSVALVAAQPPTSTVVIHEETRTVSDSQLGGIFQKIQALEIALAGVEQRMQNTSMVPQMKAMLGVLIQQIPNGPAVMSEMASSRVVRQEIAIAMQRHSELLGGFESTLQGLQTRLLATEQAVGSSMATGVPTEIKDRIDSMHADIQTFKTGFDSLKSVAETSQQGLDSLINVVSEYRRVPELARKVDELYEFFDEATKQKLAHLPDNIGELGQELIEQLRAVVQHRDASRKPLLTSTDTLERPMNKRSIRRSGAKPSQHNVTQPAGSRARSGSRSDFKDVEDVARASPASREPSVSTPKPRPYTEDINRIEAINRKRGASAIDSDGSEELDGITIFRAPEAPSRAISRPSSSERGKIVGMKQVLLTTSKQQTGTSKRQRKDDNQGSS